MNAADRPTAAPVATFLVERYWPGVTVEAFVDAVSRLQDCVDSLSRDGAAVRTVASTLVPADEAVYWIVDGPSADVVAIAFARAEITLDRTVEALELRAGRVIRAVGPGTAASDRPERGVATSGLQMGGHDGR